jgi:TolA-binding protein
LTGRPAAAAEPEPVASPLAVENDGSKPSAIVPPRLEPRAPVAPPESPAEAFLVAGALRSLRSDHAPRDALAKLDEHHRRFPRGTLQREAALARVEALLGLGRNDEARTVLDSLTLGSTGADRQARLARAELRADHGDCAGAVDDLNGILLAAANDEVAARALYRRAHCAVRARNLAAARGDLRDYLAHFPEGSRKSEVDALLRRLAE